jgi:WD40 repeat protein
VADIFISHSGKDNDIAAAIGERIRRERPTWSLFYDKDNIRAGQYWQERLRDELTSCRVVLVLLSRNWLSSSWCFTEAVTATFRGKDVIGIETEELTDDDLERAPPILHERQRVRRLRDGDERAWQEILEALDRSGLDPDDWFPVPPDVGPYPGLVAFDVKDAGVFFGRKQQITDYLGILDTLRGRDRSQVLVISGASGSGKSSLLRAGLIPRLRRKPEWVVVSPFEVAREPVRNLMDRLGEALGGFGVPAQGLDLTMPPDNAQTLSQVLDEALRRLERARPGIDAWVLLPLDQAEALVTGDRPEGDPARLLLDALAQVLGWRTRRAVVAATIRTEFVPRLEAAFAGPEVRLRQAPLSAIGSFTEIIEKPAERFGIDLEPGLSERIVEDVHTADALPLLAYTLRALHDRAGIRRRLTLDDYRTLGGVQGAIAAKLETVLSDPEPTAEETEALRRAFTRHLIRVDEGAVEGERLLRRVVPRTSLPQSADRVLRRLVDAGLLITKDGTIELAHERLINEWPKFPLRTWLAQGATDRRLIDQLRQRVNDDTLPDGLLAQAEQLLQRDRLLTVEEPALAALVQCSREQRRSREVERDRARMQFLAIQARRADAEATSPDDIERVGALALESIEIARIGKQPAEADAVEAARSALIRLPLRVLTHGSPGLLAVLGDGRLASGADDGTIKLWPKEATGEPAVLFQGSPVQSLAVLADGRLASGGHDGTIKVWPKDGGAEPMVVLSHGHMVLSLTGLSDGRLVSGGGDGKVKIWPKKGTRSPVIMSHGTQVLSLAVLADGRLASGGDDGKIKLWPRKGTGAPVVLSHGSSVKSLALLPDGRLASAGLHTIKLWSKGGTGEPVVLLHGSWVSSLAVMSDGRLVSGDADGMIKLWPGDSSEAPVVLCHGNPVWSLAVTADGWLASGGNNGQIKLWPKGGTGEPVVITQGSRVGLLAMMADGRLVSAGDHGQIRLWPKDGMGNPVVLLHGTPVWCLALLEDGRLASAGEDGQIKLWPKEGTGEPVVLEHGSGVRSLVVMSDGRLASGGDDGEIKLWPKNGASKPAVLSKVLLVRQGVQSLALMADGRLASLVGYGGTIMLWPKDGTGEPSVFTHGGGVSSLAVLPDGRLASGGKDGRIKLWPTEGVGEPVVLTHGARWVESLVILPDGRLASGSDDGTIKLWPKEGAGEPVVLEHGSGVLSLVVMSDGRLASGGEDGKIKLWLVDEEKLIAALCLRAGRNLTKDEWARYISSDTPWHASCRSRPSNWRTPD